MSHILMQIYYFWNEGKSTPMYSITVVTIKLFFIANYAEAYYKPDFNASLTFFGVRPGAPQCTPHMLMHQGYYSVQMLKDNKPDFNASLIFLV